MKAIFALLLLPLHLFSQDLSGIWKGTIATSQTSMPFELAINRDMTGYSMITFVFKGAEKTAVKKITLNQKDSFYTISDDKVIYNNFETKSRSIKTYCDLYLKTVDSTMVLSGTFHTRTRDLRAGDEDLATGTITIQKQNIKARTNLITKLDSLKLSNTLVFSDPDAPKKEVPVAAIPPAATSATSTPTASARPAMSIPKTSTSASSTPAKVPPPAPKIIEPAAEVASRKTNVIRTVDFKADSLTLILFDNGIVDGDTVSLVLNGQIIIPKLGLTDQIYRKVIRIPPGMGDSLQLVIYAENLGSIPPNSGMLIIEDGSTREEIAFEGDLKKSAAVTLRRKL